VARRRIALIDLAAIAQQSRDTRGRIAIEVYPESAGDLEALRAAGVALGAVANLPSGELPRLLADAGLTAPFEPDLLFEAPAAVQGADGVYVGECRDARATALAAGLKVAPHLRLALAVLDGTVLRYVRVTAPGAGAGRSWREALLALDLVPLHVAGENGTVIYAIATEPAASRLDDLGFAVDRLGAAGDPATTEAGSGDEVVVVGAHLDSTAAFSEGYDPANDPAPGADDNASGTVAVLAIARAAVQLSEQRQPRRSIRFLLFNAEEHGMVGSRAYARSQAQLGAAIIAAYTMDMVGYNRVGPRTWEIHAGWLAGPAVESASIDLVERLARAAALVSPTLPEPQLCRTAGPEDRDPAEGRSDHSSFQLAGFPALCVSEDFFAARQGEASEEPNPDYHMSSDTFVDVEYAADIARAVGAAVWMSANP
jgi:hypothetical protein